MLNQKPSDLALTADHLPVLNSQDIKRTISVPDLVAPLRRAMISVSAGATVQPPRHVAAVNEAGKMGVMFGAASDPPVHGAKVLSLYPDAAASGLSSHQGQILLFDSHDGRPIAVLEADILTAIRTAAATLTATLALSNPNPEVFAICGAGEQAEWHTRGFLESYPEARIRIWSRSSDRARRLVDEFRRTDIRVEHAPTLEDAVRGADVVTTVTSSKTAFLPGEMLEPGQHVNLVGASLANAREIDDEGVARLSLFTDSLASSKTESGEVIDARKNGLIDANFRLTEIGNVLAEKAEGRTYAAARS